MRRTLWIGLDMEKVARPRGAGDPRLAMCLAVCAEHHTQAGGESVGPGLYLAFWLQWCSRHQTAEPSSGDQHQDGCAPGGDRTRSVETPPMSWGQPLTFQDRRTPSPTCLLEVAPTL